MRRALTGLTALVMLGSVVPLLADTYQDNVLVDLDQSQIVSVPGGEFWLMHGVNDFTGLLLPGDRYIANLDFISDEFLRCANLSDVYFITQTVMALTYNFDYEFYGKTEGGGTTLLSSGNVTSDPSGIGGGDIPLPAEIPSIDLYGLELRLDLKTAISPPSWSSVDVGLIADTITILPEPMSLVLIALAGLALGRRR